MLLQTLPIFVLLISAATAATAATAAHNAKVIKPGPLLAAGTTKVSTLTSQNGQTDSFEAAVRPASPAEGPRRIEQILGVSVEWDRVADYDHDRWARVFSHLGPRPVIRVGGWSAELLTQVPPASTWRALKALAASSGARYIINLKLSGGDFGLTSALFNKTVEELGAYLQAFELGNEPEYWPKSVGGYFPTKNRGRSSQFTYGWEPYLSYYAQVARRLKQYNSGYPILGPSWAHFKSGFSENRARSFLAATKGTNMKEMAVHWYPAYPNANFTIESLLSEGLMREAMQEYANLMSWSQGIPVRMTEGNSKSHGGIKGISDAFAAAMWTADWAFEMAALGAPGVALHWRIGGSPDGKAGPHWPCHYMGVETAFKKGPDGRVVDTYAKAKAPWAGYLLFSRAASAEKGSVVELAGVPFATAGPGCQSVKLWPLAVRDAGTGAVTEVRAVILNKKLTGSCRVTLRLEGPKCGGGRGPAPPRAAAAAPDFSEGRLQWLLPGGVAPDVPFLSALATGSGGSKGAAVAEAEAAIALAGGLGSTLGNATLGGQSMDAEGRLQPPEPRNFAVKSVAGKDGSASYSFTIPGSSGALLKISARGDSRCQQ